MAPLAAQDPKKPSHRIIDPVDHPFLERDDGVIGNAKLFPTMICPQCKARYRQGFVECSDCQIPLVSELPEETVEARGSIELVPILRSGNDAAISVAESLLEDADIDYLVRSKGQHSLYPVGGLGVEIQVRQEDVAEAERLLEALLHEDE